MMRRLNKRGQSTLEYLLVLAGIIAALIFFKTTVQTKVDEALNDAGDKIASATSSALDDLNLGQ
ncbi:MAG: class III signal peptide-containing protein [Candidatus Omnitrophica bacterium]|nr:class III signal peptide-containing protein [Candidatus Omnitrophota bacterium]